MMEHRKQAFGDCHRDEDEQAGIDRFSRIANRYGRIFAHTGQTGAGSFFDIAAEDRTGGTIAIENKVRNIAHDRWNTTYIEPEKLENEINLWKVCGIQGMYFNYFNDGVTLVWDMARMAELGICDGLERKWVKDIRWTSADGETYLKSEWRILLPNDFALKMDRNLNITNLGEYKERIYDKVDITRKPGLLDFEELDKINDLLIWRQRT